MPPDGQRAIGQNINPKHNLPERNRFFTGREDILTQLSNLIKSNKDVAIKQAIAGLAGMGKTQTAIEFCHRHINVYQAIFWVRSENEVALNNSYSEIAILLRLSNITNSKNFKNDEIVALVKNWLSTNSNWLMVLDNLEDVTLIRKYLPNNHQGYILITTRSQALKGYAEIVPLKKMSPQTGVLFLLKRASLITIPSKTDENNKSLDELLGNLSKQEKKDAKKIVKEMDGLPLALVQAGAYIQETQCSLSTYLVEYKDVRYNINMLDNDGEDVSDHKSVFATFKLAFDKIKEQNSIAANFLQVCSLLSPDLIPEELFTQAGDLLSNELAKIKDNANELNKVAKTLLNYSLVERHTSNKSFSIHLLVQSVIRHLMDNKDKESLSNNLVESFDFFCQTNPQDSKNWQYYFRLEPSITTFFNLTKSFVEYPKKARVLLHEVGLYCKTQGRFEQALSYFLKSLCVSKLISNNDREVAITLNSIGSVLEDLGEYTTALSYFLKSLSFIELIPNNGREVAMALNNISSIYTSLGQYYEALRYAENALLVSKHLDDSLLVANSLSCIGSAKSIVNVKEALRYFKDALCIYKTLSLDDNFHNVPSLCTEIGQVYLLLGNPKEALPYYQEALSILQKYFGDKHPKVGICLWGLANVYSLESKQQEEINCLQKTLEVFDENLPPNHPWIKQLLNRYSKSLLKLNRNDEAKILQERLSTFASI